MLKMLNTLREDIGLVILGAIAVVVVLFEAWTFGFMGIPQIPAMAAPQEIHQNVPALSPLDQVADGHARVIAAQKRIRYLENGCRYAPRIISRQIQIQRGIIADLNPGSPRIVYAPCKQLKRR